MIPSIEYIAHEEGADQMLNFFPGIKKEQLPDSLGWALENITLDNPFRHTISMPAYHYHPKMDKREKKRQPSTRYRLNGATATELCLDFSAKSDGETNHGGRLSKRN